MSELEDIREDIRGIRAWQNFHDEKHGDDADMLQLVLKQLSSHQMNHHGKVSQIKQAAVPIGLIGLLATIAEIVRQFLV
jgi:hypothetical protein